MIAATAYEGRRVAVFGLGRTGVSAARSLVEGGAELLAWDDREATRDAAATHNVPIVDLEAADWSGIDALLLSPGVPHDLPSPHWSAVRARQAGVPIISDIEIFARQLAGSGARLVAITGTNGKSTTTTLVGHILNGSGHTAHVGGNIGRGVLDLPPPGEGLTYVIELSSYQLERAPSLHADVAILLNLTPDHLDRHGDMAGYEAAKRHIFDNQTADDTAVLGVDTDVGKRIVTEMKARNGRRIVPVSTRTAISHGVSVHSGVLYDAMGRKAERVCDLSGIQTLQGRHNHQNAGAAYAACSALGVSPDRIARGLDTFPGLAHRMEIVGQAGPIRFINDSKATNADSAMQALGAFPHIYWIAGGLPKAGGIAPLADAFPRIERAYLIGAAAQEFSRTLSDHGVEHTVAGELDAAVATAARDAFKAGREAVVLLSPACASFDQFKDFETRGDSFRDTVRDIIHLYEREAGMAQ